MTFHEVKESNKAFLIPAEVASVLKCHPHAIRIDAKNGTLPFPYIRIGNRVKIPREGFIAWMKGQSGQNHSDPTRGETES